nr:TRAP transporter substrate-binding protein DctP [Alkalibacter mobilis]
MLFSLVACGNSGDNGDGTDGENGDNGNEVEPVVLKFNSVKAATDPENDRWEDFFDRISTESSGTVETEMYYSESLGKTVDMIEAISQGAPILQDCDTTHLSDYVPDFSIFMHPYLFESPEQIKQLWKSEVGQRMVSDLEEEGLHLVTLVYFGTRHLISNSEVVTRDDTKDLLIRCAPTKMWNQVALTLGGNPTNTAWSEVYNALSQGVADAAESPLSLLYTAKLYEPCKNISLTGHLIASTAIVMSQDVYESLDPAAQAAIDKLGAEEPDVAIQAVQSLEGDYRAKLEAEGVKFNEVERDAFVESSKKVSSEFPEWTPGLYDSVMEALN